MSIWPGYDSWKLACPDDWDDAGYEDEIERLANEIAHGEDDQAGLLQCECGADLLDGIDIMVLLAESDEGKALRTEARKRWLEMSRAEAKNRIDGRVRRRVAA